MQRYSFKYPLLAILLLSGSFLVSAETAQRCLTVLPKQYVFDRSKLFEAWWRDSSHNRLAINGLFVAGALSAAAILMYALLRQQLISPLLQVSEQPLLAPSINSSVPFFQYPVPLLGWNKESCLIDSVLALLFSVPEFREAVLRRQVIGMGREDKMSAFCKIFQTMEHARKHGIRRIKANEINQWRDLFRAPNGEALDVGSIISSVGIQAVDGKLTYLSTIGQPTLEAALRAYTLGLQRAYQQNTLEDYVLIENTLSRPFKLPEKIDMAAIPGVLSDAQRQSSANWSYVLVGGIMGGEDSLKEGSYKGYAIGAQHFNVFFKDQQYNLEPWDEHWHFWDDWCGTSADGVLRPARRDEVRSHLNAQLDVNQGCFVNKVLPITYALYKRVSPANRS